MTNSPNSDNTPTPPPPLPPSRFRRFRRIALPVGIGLAAGLGGASWWGWRFLHEELSPLVAENLSKTLNRPVKVGSLGLQLHDKMQMVGHHRIAPNGYGERFGQLLDTPLNPSFAVFVADTTIGVLAAQKCAPHTALHAVVNTWSFRWNKMHASAGHAVSLTGRKCDVGQ